MAVVTMDRNKHQHHERNENNHNPGTFKKFGGGNDQRDNQSCHWSHSIDGKATLPTSMLFT